jgi:hypothetical protein
VVMPRTAATANVRAMSVAAGRGLLIAVPAPGGSRCRCAAFPEDRSRKYPVR